MLRYSSCGRLAISRRPCSYTFSLGATANSLMPMSRALSACIFIPPHGLPVTWPSVMTTAKFTPLAIWVWICWVMLEIAQSVKVPRPRYLMADSLGR